VNERDQPPNRRLTIGELASLAGISTRTVRHYHAVGLLPEPERDTAGYRRYRTSDAVTLVRIVRLRAVGMPIARIAALLADPSGDSGDLRRLAAELAEEIARLTRLEERLLSMAEQSAPTPADAVAGSLRAAGRLGPDESLAPSEAAAVELVDALHPAGAAGIMDAMAPLLADRTRADRLAELVRQVRDLDADDDDQRLDELAAELVAILPRVDPPPVPIDLDVFEKLLGHRLTDVQRRFHRRLRAAMDGSR